MVRPVDYTCENIKCKQSGIRIELWRSTGSAILATCKGCDELLVECGIQLPAPYHYDLTFGAKDTA